MLRSALGGSDPASPVQELSARARRASSPCPTSFLGLDSHNDAATELWVGTRGIEVARWGVEPQSPPSRAGLLGRLLVEGDALPLS